MGEVEGVGAVERGGGFGIYLPVCKEEGWRRWFEGIGRGFVPVAGGGEDRTDVDGGGDGEGVSVDFVAELAGESEESCG